MIPVTQYNTMAVAVLGLGRSGLSAARALKAGGATPVCWDDNENSLSAAEEEGFLIANLHEGRVWEEHDFKVLVLSPGIPHLYPQVNPIVRLAWKYGVPVDNDVGLFLAALDEFPERDVGDAPEFVDMPAIICITGSNGKSTVTALVHHIFKEAGRNVQMGGNIGRGVLDLDLPRSDEIYVLELSSYQTELASILTCDIGAFLNFSPDHYDRHGGRGGYFAAKRRLFEFAVSAVIGIDEDEGFFLHNSLLDRDVEYQDEDRVTAITANPGFCVGKNRVVVGLDHLVSELASGQSERLDLADLANLRGAHNRQNCATAFAICRKLELPVNDILSGLKTYLGLPHRMEQVGRLDKVSFVNDSKATNVDAAAKSLGAFKNIYWIAGGQAKEGELDELKDFIPNIKKAFLIGEGAGVFAHMLGHELPHEMSGTLEKALEQAVSEAAALGEEAVVLLAPACASFDQFKSFEHRGDRFRELAKVWMDKD